MRKKLILLFAVISFVLSLFMFRVSAHAVTIIKEINYINQQVNFEVIGAEGVIAFMVGTDDPVFNPSINDANPLWLESTWAGAVSLLMGSGAGAYWYSHYIGLGIDIVGALESVWGTGGSPSYAYTYYHRDMASGQWDFALDDPYQEYSGFTASSYLSGCPFIAIFTDGSITTGFTLDIELVPEPATMLLLGCGLASLAGFRRKMKKRI